MTHKNILSNITLGDKPRDVRIDAMRVFAIFFIVTHHLVNHVIPFGAMETAVDFGILGHYLTVSLWDCFLIVGVNVFFAASGFFSTSLKPRKMVTLLVKVYVYWLLGMLIAWAVDPARYATALDFFKELAIAIARYWFVIVYMLLMLAAPILNKLAQYLAAKTSRIRYFVFLTTLFFCVIGFISDNIYPYMGTDGGYTVIWAAIPYVYGRLIRLKEDKLRGSTRFWALLYVAFSLLNYAVIAPLVCTDHGDWAMHCYSYNNPLVLASSLCFVMMFVTAKCNKNNRFYRFLSLLSTHTLGVYLIHTNNPFLHPRRNFLINLVQPMWAKYLLLPINALLLVAIGVIVDIAYEWLLGKPVGKMAAWIEKGILWVYNKVMMGLQKAFARVKPADIQPEPPTNEISQEGEENAGTKQAVEPQGSENKQIGKE